MQMSSNVFSAGFQFYPQESQIMQKKIKKTGLNICGNLRNRWMVDRQSLQNHSCGLFATQQLLNIVETIFIVVAIRG